MIKNGHPRRKAGKAAAFVTRAERALRRAAYNVKTRNRALGLHFCLMKTTESIRKYAAEQGVSEEEALKRGLESKAKEFVENGAEVYAKA